MCVRVFTRKGVKCTTFYMLVGTECAHLPRYHTLRTIKWYSYHIRLSPCYISIINTLCTECSNLGLWYLYILVSCRYKYGRVCRWTLYYMCMRVCVYIKPSTSAHTRVLFIPVCVEKLTTLHRWHTHCRSHKQNNNNNRIDTWFLSFKLEYFCHTIFLGW